MMMMIFLIPIPSFREEVIDDLLSSSVDLFVVPSHLYKKNRNLAVPAISCERRRTLSVAREIHKSSQKKKKKHTLATTFLENSNFLFLGRRKGEREKDKTRLLIRNHHPPLRQNLMRIRQIRQFFLFGFRPIIHRRSIIDCRSRTILTMMMMTIDTIQ